MTPAAAPPGRAGWAAPLAAVIAVLAVVTVVAGLMFWAPWGDKTSGSGVLTRQPSASALYRQMRASAAAARSVHVKGAFVEQGKKLQIDVAGDRAGKSSRAIVNAGTDEIEILSVNGSYYFKADAAYWTKNGSADIAKLTAGKYVKIPAGSAAGLGNLRVGRLLDQILARDMSTANKLSTKVEKTELNGLPAYLVTDRVGGNGSKIYVSTDGLARLMRVEGAKDEGALDFTEWDAVPPLSPPPRDQIVRLPGL